VGYVERHLLTDERVLYKTRLHWVLMLRPVLVVVLGLAMAACSWWADASSDWWTDARSALRYVGAAAVLAGLLWALVRYVEMRTSEFAVTNIRLILKVGLIARYTTELLISKVESIAVAQSLAGRVLGYGDLTVTGTGGAREVFRRVKDPISFRNHVQRASIPASPRSASTERREGRADG
jgi:uncharacterized membrane protein YdbT with pleckstrin-like domain